MVYAAAFGDNQEKKLLQPAIEGVRKNFAKANICDDAFKDTTLLADTGYHSDSNVELLMKQDIYGIIADTQFRKPTDKHKDKYLYKRFHQADFIIDKDRNVLVCPAGKTLPLLHASYLNNTELIGPMYQADIKDCACCMYKKKCLTGKSASGLRSLKDATRMSKKPLRRK